PEEEWHEVLAFLHSEKLVSRTGGNAWVLSRDLHHYQLHTLISRSPWPLPAPERLPEQLPEPWYPALRQALEALQIERTRIFSGNLAEWLRGPLTGEE